MKEKKGRKKGEVKKRMKGKQERIDGYYVAYKPVTLPCISFMFIEIKFIHYHSCMMLAMEFMSICND